jgi:hypothetical protein
MNFNKMLKKLLNNQTLMILAAIVVVCALYFYSKGFSMSMSGMENTSQASGATDSQGGMDDNNIQCAAGGNNFVPSNPLGQNSANASASGASTDTYGLPPSCAKQQVVDPSELLPRDNNSQFSKLNPTGAGDLKNVSLLKAGHHIGINTVGQSLRNANLQLRSEPANPQLNTGPWNQTSMTPDMQRRPLEIGCGSQ